MFVIPVPFATPAFDELLALRYLILRKPLDMDYTAEQIAAEWDSTHLACYSPGWRLLGCLTLLPANDQELKMRQVAVAPEAQGKGVGRFIVAASEEWARGRHYAKMVLHARETAVPFYQKLDYRTVGKRFEEVGIPHYKMEKDL